MRDLTSTCSFVSSGNGIRFALFLLLILVASTASQAQTTFHTLYDFGSTSTDGSEPLGGLVMDSAGNLYGTTFGGGDNSYGSVFQLSPPA